MTAALTVLLAEGLTKGGRRHPAVAIELDSCASLISTPIRRMSGPSGDRHRCAATGGGDRALQAPVRQIEGPRGHAANDCDFRCDEARDRQTVGRPTRSALGRFHDGLCSQAARMWPVVQSPREAAEQGERPEALALWNALAQA